VQEGVFNAILVLGYCMVVDGTMLVKECHLHHLQGGPSPGGHSWWTEMHSLAQFTYWVFSPATSSSLPQDGQSCAIVDEVHQAR